MNFIKTLLAAAALFTTNVLIAAPIGNLNFDGTFINGDGKVYLGLNQLVGQTYTDVISLTSSGGLYEDFRIANSADADFFIDSLFGNTPDGCSTTTGAGGSACGTVSDWSDGSLGDNFDGSRDYFYFLADRFPPAEVGFFVIDHTGYSEQSEGWSYFSIANQNTSISWLIVKDAVSVPEPSGIVLMGAGLIGLGFVRRRIKK